MKLCLNCDHAFESDEWICPTCKYQPKRINSVVAHAPEFESDYRGFRPQYFNELEKLEDKNFWFRARNEILVWSLKTYGASVNNFLEVGCGTGFVLKGIAHANPNIALHGSEIFLEGLSHAQKRVPNGNFMQLDARNIPFVEEFDAIGAFDVLEHIEEDNLVIEQLIKALKIGGILILTVPQHRWLWSQADVHACHVRRYTAKALHKKIKSNGLLIERSTSFVSTLLPLMFLTRRRKTNVNSYDPQSELNLPSKINSVLYFILKLEIALIQLGISLPVGGSRLLVARKVS